MSVTIEEVIASSSEVVAGLNHLLPQLSTTAQLLTSVDVERLIDAPGTTVFVARDGDTIVGTLTLVVFDIPSGTRAWIEDVVVDESVRGRGIGEELTRA
ncbi:MAG: GNAT family N-acetyltransferase, partial [Acidimicrobiales bacterium]